MSEMDGSGATTVMVKDSLLVTTLVDQVQIVATIGNIIYLGVASGSTATQTQLRKSDGSAAGTVMVANLAWTGSNGGQPPKNFIVMGTKLYFTFGLNNGGELWVSDGTTAGTVEVVNLSTGSSSGIQNAGIDDNPMMVFNGKLYFAGTTGLSDYELYASDGTVAGTALVYDLRPGVGSARPQQFAVLNNELYFTASDGSVDNLWKTTGTTTTKLSTGINAGWPIAFKNNIYFAGGIALWKTDGTAAGTVRVADSFTNSAFRGANSSYLFALYTESLSVAPYIKTHYKRTDGTAAGTREVDANLLGNSASFNLLNDKMYLVRSDSNSSATGAIGLWESDGTEGGTRKLFNSYGTGAAYNFNGTFHFANFTTDVGYEPFYYSIQAPAGVATSGGLAAQTLVYPNPSAGNFEVSLNNDVPFTLELRDLQGKTVYSAKCAQRSVHVSVPDIAKGLYLLKVSTDGP